MASTNFIQATDNPLAAGGWEYCLSFHPGTAMASPVFSKSGLTEETEWVQAKQRKKGGTGLNLRSIAIRPKCELALRSLAAEMKCAVRLIGESTLWIFSRVEGDQLSQSTAVLQIKKPALSFHLELTFGILIGQGKEGAEEAGKERELKFQFVKKQLSNDSSCVLCLLYSMDLNLVFLDNGDETLAVKLFFNPSKVLRVQAKQFVPVFPRSSIVLAGKLSHSGSGHGVHLKAC